MTNMNILTVIMFLAMALAQIPAESSSDQPNILEITNMNILTVITSMAMVLAHGRGDSSPDQPNILFIMADDLGWSDVSWHDRQMVTPNLLALSHVNAVKLESAYVNYLCTPTRSAFLTGYDPYYIGTSTGVFDMMEPSGLPLVDAEGNKIVLLPEKLQEAGYTTYMVGKWHLGHCHKKYLPNSRGFDYFNGYFAAGQDYYTRESTGGNRRQYAGYDFWRQQEVDAENTTYSTELYTTRAKEYLNVHANSKEKKPFFLYLAYQAVHTPLMNGGLILEGASNWPYRGAKATLWEGGCKAVSFVHSPRHFPTSRTHKQLFHVVDWYPTILNMVGQAVPKHASGINQWDALLGKANSTRDLIIYNIGDTASAIRVDNYKLIVGNGGAQAGWYTIEDGRSAFPIPDEPDVTLFNLDRDPYERKDISATHPFLVRKLKSRLEKLRDAPHLDSVHKDDIEEGNPANFDGVWGWWGKDGQDGWCTPV